MQIFKYKTFEDAEKAIWELEPDNDYFSLIELLFKLANEMSSIRYPREVFKFAELEEANKHREKIKIDNALAVQKKNF